MSLYRITLPGRAFVIVHSWSKTYYTARLIPAVPRDVREWLRMQRLKGHFAYASTCLETRAIDIFQNVRITPAQLPVYESSVTEYIFANLAVAMLFKLTFGGMNNC